MQFNIKDHKSNRKIINFSSFFHSKNLRDLISPCHKIGQSLSRVIIYIKLKTKIPRSFIPTFKAICPVIFNVFTIYGHVSHPGHVT